MKHFISALLCLSLLTPVLAQKHFRTVDSEPAVSYDPLVFPQGTAGVWAVIRHRTTLSASEKDAEKLLSWCTVSRFGKGGQGDRNFRLDAENYPSLNGHQVVYALPMGEDLHVFSIVQDVDGDKMRLFLTALSGDGKLGESRVIDELALHPIESDMGWMTWANHSPDYSKVVIVWPLRMGYSVYNAAGERLVDARFKKDSGIDITKAAVNNEGLPSLLLSMNAKGLNKVSLGLSYHTSLSEGAKVCEVTSPPGGFSDQGVYLQCRASGNPVLVMFGLNANGFIKGMSFTEVNLSNGEVARKVIDDKSVNWSLEIGGSGMYLADDGNIFIPSGKYDLHVLKISPDFKAEGCDWVSRPYKDILNSSVYRVFDGKTIRCFVVCDEKALKNLPKLKLGFSEMDLKGPRSLVEVSRAGCGDQVVKTIASNVKLQEFNQKFLSAPGSHAYCVNGFVVLPGHVTNGKDKDPVFIVWEE
jgi:hypothetical protein